MEDRILEIERQLQLREETARSLSKVVRFLWAFLVGAFALGGWVASIQMTQAGLEREMRDHRSEAKLAEIRIRAIETTAAAHTAGVTARLDALAETLSRIDRKLNP